jgi:hypothetical protein
MWRWIKNIAAENEASFVPPAPIMIERLERREFFSVSPASAPIIAITPIAPIVHPQVTTNPLVGDYSGTFMRLTDSKMFPVKVEVTQKGSKVVIVAKLSLSGLGEEDLEYNISPSSSGTFTVNLGPNSNWGTMKGHLNNGKLVLSILVPGNSPIKADLKRTS